jgi:hypothetical protein
MLGMRPAYPRINERAQFLRHSSSGSNLAFCFGLGALFRQRLLFAGLCPKRGGMAAHGQPPRRVASRHVPRRTKSPLRVISGHFALQSLCRLYPRKRPQKRTWALTFCAEQTDWRALIPIRPHVRADSPAHRADHARAEGRHRHVISIVAHV